MKKMFSLILATAMTLSLAACGGGKETPPVDTSTDPAVSSEPQDDGGQGSTAEGGTVYYLNFKPEIADVYNKVAEDYKKETGVNLKVVTAAAGTYEQTLKSEIAKKDAPTLFQINGPVGYLNWKDYCKDLKDTEIYKHLSDKSLAVTSGDGVYGIPYTVEGYGIIYNKAIMDKYFSLPEKIVPVDSVEEITDFETLQQVVQDMTVKKSELGIEGVFASTSLSPGEDWRWQTHLANVPIYYELKNNNVDLSSGTLKEIEFKYNENFKNIFDLYTDYSCTEKGLLGAKAVTDSMAEFALGKVAMVQNGNWAWSQINEVQGNIVKEEDIKFMPIYTGMDEDKTQGLCVGTENFFAVNAKASPEDQKLAEDFIYWLFSSETGKKYVIGDLGFMAPFDTFSDSETPSDPLAKEIVNWLNKDGITSVSWMFPYFPGQQFKDNFGAALLEYAQGSKTWEELVTLVVEDWKTESSFLEQ